MVRQLSAANIKGHNNRTRLVPEEGTYLRELYDAFHPPLTLVNIRQLMALTTGETAHLKSNKLTSALERLRDHYGLDIRKHSKGNRWLVGEYNARGVYIDYLAEYMKDKEL